MKYIYDALDRLVEVCSDTVHLSFSYDSFHRRMTKEVAIKKGNRWVVVDFERFIYDGDNEIGSEDLIRVKTNQLRMLSETNRAEIGSAVAIEIEGNVYGPVHDLYGNLSLIQNINSSPDGEFYQYSAFGEERIFTLNGIIQEDSIVNNPWRYSSKRKDKETSLIYFGRRYYDPEIGRWITPDPEGFTQGLNLYSYLLNDPLLKVDLYGLIVAPMMIQNFECEEMMSNASNSLAGLEVGLRNFANGYHEARTGSIMEGRDALRVPWTRGLGRMAGLGVSWGEVYAGYQMIQFGIGLFGSIGAIDISTGGAGVLVTAPAATAAVSTISVGSGLMAHGGKSLWNFAKLEKNISGKGEKGYKSTNQLDTDIKKGRAPKTLERADIRKKIGEQDHVHLKDGRALNRDGTFKHDFKQKGPSSLTNKTNKFIKKYGFNVLEE